jgi:hypothetical protein
MDRPRSRGRFFHGDAREDVEQVRVLPFDERHLLRGALGDGQQVAAADVGAEEGGDAPAARLALAHLHQFHQVAEVENRLFPGSLAPQFLTAFLPHAVAGHPRHQP